MTLYNKGKRNDVERAYLMNESIEATAFVLRLSIILGGVST